MKLPHVTIEYREEEAAGVGKVSPSLIVGFGLHWAWIFSAIFSSNLIFPFWSQDASSVMMIVSMLCMAVTLLCYTFFFSRVRPLFQTMGQRRRVRFFAALFASVGTLIIALGAGIPAIGACVALEVVGGVLTGVGTAALLMSYGVSFSICDSAAAAMQFALSSVVTGAAYGFILAIDTVAHPAGAVICVAVPWLELLCLNLCSKQLVDRTEFTATMMPVRPGRFTLHLAPSAFAFGLLFGFLGIHAFRDVATLVFSARPFVLIVIAGGVLVCLLVVCVMLTQRQQANYAFRTLNPIIAFLIAVVAYLAPMGSAMTTHCLFLVCYMLIEASLWISFSDMSQKFRISPFRVFGVGRGFLALGAVLATVLMLPESPLCAVLNSTDSILPIALVLLVFATSSYPRDPEIIRVLVRGRICPAFFDPLETTNESAKVIAAAAWEAEVADAQGASGVCEGAGQDVRGESAAVAVSEGATEVADACSETPTASDASDVGVGAAVDEPGDDKQASEAKQAPEQVKAALGAEDGEQDEQRIGRYKRRCLALADACLLSRRETEVLFLLAKGYNTKMIQEQLYISAGTANTHMRHVYRKLDVHSQQDLIRMVDSIEVADEAW